MSRFGFMFVHLIISSTFTECQNSFLIDAVHVLSRRLPKEGEYNTTMSTNDIICTLFSRSTPLNGIILTNETYTYIDNKVPLKYFIHGYLGRKKWYIQMTQEYLKKGNYQIIHLDWSKGSTLATGYVTSRENTKIVGNFLADHILFLNSTLKMDLNNIHVIGLSLGSHIVGMAAKSINKRTNGQRIFRITGLDPAGTLYELEGINKSLMLDKNDAHFVDIVHTDGGMFGHYAPLGHVDFYANGGTFLQPGCLSFNMEYTMEDLYYEIIGLICCSHERSIYYFMEAINTPSFEVEECNSTTNECKQVDIMFGEDIDVKANGIFYFYTNRRPPYGTKSSLNEV